MRIYLESLHCAGLSLVKRGSVIRAAWSLPQPSLCGFNESQPEARKKTRYNAQTALVAPMNKHSLPGSKIFGIPNFPVIIHNSFCFLRI